MEPLESLNKSLQPTTMAVAWMLEAAAAVKSQYDNMRGYHEFDKMLVSFDAYRKELALEEISLPLTRSPPSRFCGQGDAFHAMTVKQYYRIEFRKIIDVATQQLNQRLLVQCPVQGLLATASLNLYWCLGR